MFTPPNVNERGDHLDIVVGYTTDGVEWRRKRQKDGRPILSEDTNPRGINEDDCGRHDL